MAEQSMEQMKAILDNAPVAVFVCSIKDRSLLYTNSLARELFPRSGGPGAACYHIAGYEEPCPFCHIGEMSREAFVVREFSPPHNSRVYQLSGKLIDWAGETAHIEYILDITEKKREEEQFRKDEERMRRQYEGLILEHYRTPGTDELLLGHCNITQNKILQLQDFTGCNLLKTLGSNRERFFTGLAGFIVDEEERKSFLGTYRNAPSLAAFAKGETEQVQTCFVKLPGQDAGRYLQIQMNLIAEPGTGDVTGVLTVTDVTDSIMSEQLLRRLSVTTHDYIVDVDLLSDSFKLLSSSQNAYLVPEAAGSHSQRVAYMAETVLLEKDRERYAEALRADTIQRRLQEEDSYTVPYAMLDEAGGIHTKNMTVFALDLRLGRVCLVCTDITDSVRALEDALALAKEASRAKSDFLTAMSHDIRTPMNAIMGMTTLAMAYLDDRDRVEDCLRKIKAANKHLLSLINDVLDMSRIERSKITMNLRPLSLSELIDEAAAIIGPQAKDAGIRFTVEKRDIREERFYGDPLRIHQILINLLSNAVKFTPEGGRVELLAEQIPPFSSGNRVRFRFTVRDTGIGISEEFLSRVFDPFARENTAAGVEGTGLGLSIVKGLADRMGGTISVESHEDRGTAFQVELEFEAEIDPEKASPKKSAENDVLLMEKPFAGRMFLVAEDNAINAELLCELLKIDGAGAAIAVDGAEAVQQFQDAAPGTYDAILMDIQMPAMTGYEAARAVRALSRPDAKTIPIIAMTANAFSEDVQASYDAGMNGHVAKPIDVDVLRSTVGKALKSEATENSGVDGR